MKYKVGDKVKIREDLKVDKKYGYFCFVDEMTPFRGQIVTIETGSTIAFTIDGSQFLWAYEMIEKKVNEIKVIDLLNMIAEGKEVPKFRFKFKQGKKYRVYRYEGNNKLSCEENSSFMYIGTLIKQCGNNLNYELEIIEDTPILDEKEKEYLSAVIKPFRDEVNYIVKFGFGSDETEYITIGTEAQDIYFPHFQEGTMYKGMELNKKYTLEELDL